MHMLPSSLMAHMSPPPWSGRGKGRVVYRPLPLIWYRGDSVRVAFETLPLRLPGLGRGAYFVIMSNGCAVILSFDYLCKTALCTTRQIRYKASKLQTVRKEIKTDYD